MKTLKSAKIAPKTSKPYSIHTPTLKRCVGASLDVLAAIAGVRS